MLIPVLLSASRDGVDSSTTRGQPCLARIGDHSYDKASKLRLASVETKYGEFAFTLGPPGPSRTAHTAEPHTMQLLHRQCCRSLQLLVVSRQER